MGDPATMAVASMGMKVGGSIMGAVGSMQSGEAAGRMYDYRAAVAGINKQIAQQNADYARYAGEVEAQQAGMKARYRIGAMRAQQAASGLALGSGSGARVLQSTYDVAQHDIAILRSNAAKKAYGYDVEAFEQGAQAELDRMAASQSRKAGKIGAISSLLGGATGVADKWQVATEKGIFGGGSGSGGDVGMSSIRY